MASKKRNVIVGQSGGPTSVINSSLAGVYKNAIERGFDKVYGMLHGVQGLLDEQYVDMSASRKDTNELNKEIMKEIEEFINDYYDRYSGIYLKSKTLLDYIK